jgi:hypothetical protein
MVYYCTEPYMEALSYVHRMYSQQKGRCGVGGVPTCLIGLNSPPPPNQAATSFPVRCSLVSGKAASYTGRKNQRSYTDLKGKLYNLRKLKICHLCLNQQIMLFVIDGIFVPVRQPRKFAFLGAMSPENNSKAM